LRVSEWPSITEPQVLRRLGLSDDDMFEFMLQRAAQIPVSEFTEDVYAHAIAYPWARPQTSYLWVDGEIEPMTDLPDLGEKLRFPLLAIGSNAAPDSIAWKMTQLPEGEDRTLAVVLGRLHDFDIGPCATPTIYGSLAATLFESPGTAVSAAVLWVTEAQLNVFVALEVSYAFGRLDEIRFVPDLASGEEVTSAYVFVNRFGVHCVDGEPVALAAIPADGRTAVAYTEEQLLERMASLVLGDGHGPRDVVRRIMEDFDGWTKAAAPALRDLVQPFESQRFTLFRPS